MYAQLCKRLSETAPNFDPENKPVTFKRLLLNKCRDEFENRTQICQGYEKQQLAFNNAAAGGSSAATAVAEQELLEAKFGAKRKMLGNIKFIGELGKLQIVHDSILHRCCEQLLVGRRRQPIEDQSEDLECLCHLMKTCGRLLDTPKAKVRMDQYFERLHQVTSNNAMPLRIRFIVQDIIEMRRNKWNGRKVGLGHEGPRTIQQVREDAYRDGCIYMPQQSPPGSAQSVLKMAANAGLSGMSSLINPLEGSFFDKKPDLFGATASTTSTGAAGAGGYLGTGPGTISYEDDEDDDDVNDYPTTAAKNNIPTSSNINIKNNNGAQREPREQPQPKMQPQQQHRLQQQHQQPPPPPAHQQQPHHQQQQHHHAQPPPQHREPQFHQPSPTHSNRSNKGHRDQNPTPGEQHRQQQQQQLNRNRSPSPPSNTESNGFNNHYNRQRDNDMDEGSYNNRQYDGGRGGRGGGFRGRGGGFNSYNNRGGGGGGFQHRERDDGDRFNRERDDGDRFNRDRDSGFNRGEKPIDFGDRYSANRGPKDGGPPSRGGGGRRLDDERVGGDRGGYRGGFGGRGGYRGGNNMDSPADQDGGAPRFRKDGPPQMRGGYNSYHGGYQRDSPPPSQDGRQMPNMGSQGPPKDLSEVSLRPQTAASNMLFKPKTPSMLPKSAIRGTTDGSSPLGENSLLGPPLPTAPTKVMMQQEAPIMIKQGSLDKNKKDRKAASKGPTREEVFAKTEEIIAELITHQSTNEACEKWREGEWLPSKMNQTAVTHLLKTTLIKKKSEDGDNTEFDLCLTFLAQLVADDANSINATHCQEALAKIASGGSGQVKELKGNMAKAFVWGMNAELFTLKDCSEMLLAGSAEDLHPVFLETLQGLKGDDEDKLKALYDGSSIVLQEHVPEALRGDEALVSLLSEYQLSFLMPLLSVQQEMTSKLTSLLKDDAANAAAEFASWIQTSVSSAFHTSPDFIIALFQVVMKKIVESTTLSADGAVSSDKALVEAEKEMLDRFRPVLTPFVKDRPELQLTGVYALQVFCHEHGFPKGLLLRLFVNCYEMDVFDEHAFLQWKEDVNDTYAGKGKALFQVNTWLTWLEEAESEEEEEEED